MSISKVMYKDKDGFHYKHPNRSCTRCISYPCLSGMNKLKGNFGAYGCKLYQDINVFDVWEPKR